MFHLCTEVADARAGFYAALLLNLSPVFGVTAGTWVLPDGPLDCALLAATLALIHALPATGRRAVLWWLASGLFAGLALVSKYSAILWLGGAFVYLLSSRVHRHWLAHPAPWLAVLLVALLFAPVALWNATHGWASFAFQGERAAGLRFHPLGPLIVVAGEALFVLPWIWGPMLRVAFAALPRLRAGRRLVQPARAVPLGGARLPDPIPAARPGGGARRELAWPPRAGRHRRLRRPRDRDRIDPDPDRLARSGRRFRYEARSGSRRH
jgi:4-amino-4-deoxy-L-arabinose transferase-like glycosyltransferase